jgi:cytochrome c biogenesis protein CcdA/thiol-disulfide isomerase/thioredoxin
VALLIAFAFVAGAATALSPCVLPVLPVALSAGVTGGRRRPLGVVTGLAISFAFATVALVYVIDALGLPDGLLRTLAIAVLLGFGVALVVPGAVARIEARLGRLVRRSPRTRRGDGFGSGLLVGLSLGLVYAPCAGPILAGVITVSASQPFTAGRLAVALSYAIGSAVALYALMLGGRRLTRRLSPHSGRLQTAMGAVMVVVAVLMLANVDTRFQTAIASDLPAFLVNPSERLERTDDARKALADVRGGRGGRPLPVYGRAPELVGTQRWFNTPGGRALTLRELRGKVVLVDFWTYTCINCIRTLPQLRAWHERYAPRGLVIVGVHTPEFPFERSAANVQRAIEQNRLPYAVVQDNEYATWNAYGNRYWPAKYFIDARGRVRYVHFGEGDDAHSERVIRTLLEEAGRDPGRGEAGERAEPPPTGATTPESYLGATRAQRFAGGPPLPGVQTFPPVHAPLARDQLALVGRWRVGAEAVTAVARARLRLDFTARRVFLVLGSAADAPRPVRVLLDGRPLADDLAGADVRSGRLTVSRHRLYSLVALPRPGRHLLTLEAAPRVSGYAFTFG